MNKNLAKKVPLMAPIDALALCESLGWMKPEVFKPVMLDQAGMQAFREPILDEHESKWRERLKMSLSMQLIYGIKSSRYMNAHNQLFTFNGFAALRGRLPVEGDRVEITYWDKEGAKSPISQYGTFANYSTKARQGKLVEQPYFWIMCKPKFFLKRKK